MFFFNLPLKGLFGAHRTYLLIETLKLQEVFLSIPKTILKGKQYA
jgi:hypothetical protein